LLLDVHIGFINQINNLQKFMLLEKIYYFV